MQMKVESQLNSNQLGLQAKKQEKPKTDAFAQVIDQMAQSVNKPQSVQNNQSSFEKVESQVPDSKDKDWTKLQEIAVAMTAVQTPVDLLQQMPQELLEGVSLEMLEGISATQTQQPEMVQQIFAQLGMENQQAVLSEGIEASQTAMPLDMMGLESGVTTQLEVLVNQQAVSRATTEQPTLLNAQETTKQTNLFGASESRQEEAFVKLQNVVMEASQQDTQTQEFELSRSFRDAVALVKQQVQQKQQDSGEAEPLDVDALQMHANAQRPQLEGQVKMQQVQADSNEQPVDLAKQISEKMLLHLEKGEREFTMKLNPESLGEITVKLLQKDGKMTLSIAAASETTVKLLNGEMEALRMAVRPMQVEVRQAVVQTQDADGQNMQQQMDMSSGQFFDHSQQAQQQAQQFANGRANAVPFDLEQILEQPATMEQAQQAAQTIADNLLDLYV